MFERFTQRARQVVVLSQEEARKLDHNYIGTEHILLGLLGASESVAVQVLAASGISRDGVRAEVEEMVGRGKAAAPSGHIPFTPRAKKTLELSLREALSLGHNYIGTEHVLLGLIREGDGVAVQILRRHADLAELRAAVIAAAPPTAGNPSEDESADETNAVLRWLRSRLGRHGASSVPLRLDVPEAPAAARGTPAAEAALREAAALAGPSPVGSHHLLLAALADPASAASSTLAGLGVDLDDLREKLRSAPLAGTSDELPEEAGRRQMALQVSDEILTIVLTDPVIVAAAAQALRTVEGSAGPSGAGPSGAGPSGAGPDAGGGAVAAGVIRGDHPAAANLANVWLELRETLETLGGAGARPRSRRRKYSGQGTPLAPSASPAADEPGEDAPGDGGTGSAGEA